MRQYRDAFVRGDVDALVDCFAFPLQVASVVGDEVTVSVAVAEEWPGVLEGLLGAYRRLEVTDAVTRTLTVDEPVRGVAFVRVHWELQRAGGEPIYDFTALYTMARTDGRLRIVAIAHDELPRLHAALRTA